MNFSTYIKSLFNDVVRDRDDLHDYQEKKLVPWIKANPMGLIIVDMGLGKTVSLATAIQDQILHGGWGHKILIIGPPRVALETWPTEFRLWQHLAWLKPELLYVHDDHPEVLEAERSERAKSRLAGCSPNEVQSRSGKAGTAMKDALRERAARSAAQIHVLPNNHVEWLVNLWGPRWPYRWVIIDESSAFKDHTTSRFKALAKVRNTPGLITHMHLASATPAAETYLHLFAQIFLIDGGKRFGKHITRFQDEFFTQNRWSRKWTLRPNAEQQILDKIADISIVMKAEQYLNLALPSVLVRPIHLSARQMALYKEMMTEFIVTLDDGTEVEAETAAALSAKLLQMASGVLYETVESPPDEQGFIKKTNRIHKLHEHKIEEMKQIVDELQGKPVLVAYHFKSSLERLQRAFPKAVVMDREGKCVKAWNAGKIPMLLMHPQSGGHGLNLQAGGHNMVFFDLPWSLELYLQFIGRLARQGQKHPVMVWILQAVGTIDQQVLASLMGKQDAQEKFFAWLRRKIKKMRAERRALVSSDEEL